MFGPFEGIILAAIDWRADARRTGFLTRCRAHDPGIRRGSGVAEHYRGWDGLVRYLQEWLEPFSDYHVENLDYLDAGDCVLIPSRQWGVGGGGGAPVEIELTTLYEVRHGRMARLHQFDTLEEAVAAAGNS